MMVLLQDDYLSHLIHTLLDVAFILCQDHRVHVLNDFEFVKTRIRIEVTIDDLRTCLIESVRHECNNRLSHFFFLFFWKSEHLHDWFPQQAGMDSLFDLGWRIALGLTALGLIVLFIQNRSKPGPDDLGKEWMQDREEYESNAVDNRPVAAPSFDDFK